MNTEGARKESAYFSNINIFNTCWYSCLTKEGQIVMSPIICTKFVVPFTLAVDMKQGYTSNIANLIQSLCLSDHGIKWYPTVCSWCSPAVWKFESL